MVLSIIRHDERLTVRLVGRREGSSAEDLRPACLPSALDLDLSGVTSIDGDGERALVWAARSRGDIPWRKTVCAQVMGVR
jgi:hypothetical protein